MKAKRIVTLLLVLMIGLGLTSCRKSTPDTSSIIEPVNIVVNRATPTQTFSWSEPVPLPNCNGTEILPYGLEKLSDISHQTTIGVSATIEGGVKVPISGPVQAELRSSIEANYQQVLKNAEQTKYALNISTSPHTSVVYTVEWWDQVYTSTITFENRNNPGLIYQVPYTYTVSVPKYGGVEDKPCSSSDGSSENVPPPEPPKEAPPTEPPSPKYLHISRTIVEPSPVPPGAIAAIYVYVMDENYQPVEGATVMVEAGGGKFLESETAWYDPNERLMGPFSSAGYTGLDGLYATWWVCNPCAPGYGMSVTINKDGYIGTTGEVTFDIAE